MIKIEFTGESLDEVKALAAEFAGSESTPAKTATRSRAKKPAAADDDDDAPVKKKPAKSEALTVDDVRTAMSAKVDEDEDNGDLIKAILKKHGAAKASELEEDDYEAVIKAINKL